MSYDMQMLGHCLSWGSNAYLTAANLAATAADWAVLKVQHPVQLKRISIFITTAVTAGQTAPQVTVWSRPTSATTANQVSLGVLTIPTAAAVGGVYYKELESVRIPAGYDLALQVSRQAADAGTAAGAGFIGFLALADQEVPANQSKMVASA